MKLPKMKGEKKDDLGRKLMGKKNCGNGIAKMRGGKNSSNWFMAMLLPKWKGEKGGNWFVAMELQKIGERKIP